MRELKERWEALDPKLKQRGILVFTALTVLGLAWAFVTSGDHPKESAQRDTKRIAKDILTGRDAEGLGIEGMATDLEHLAKAVEDLNAALEREKEERQSAEQAFQALTENTNKALGDRLSETVDELRSRERDLARLQSERPRPPENAQGTQPQSERAEETPTSNDTVVDEEWDLFKKEPPAVSGRTTPTDTGRGQTGPPGNVPRSAPITYQEYTEKPGEAAPAEQEKAEELSLPAGSIVSGTILTGLDAPTSKSTKQDPFPVLVRVKHAAILPNRFRLDVRECFIVGAGWGDLSSERAYIRAESLSCVRNDGEILESRLDAYAVGEDSKAGIRGRLVSKQGQVLANAMLAGFASGISKAFQPQAIPVLGSTSEDRFSTPAAGLALQAGALGGVSESMERLADFYIDLAEEMFPVIEIDAGRAVTFIINRGGSLELASSTPQKRATDSTPNK